MVAAGVCSVCVHSVCGWTSRPVHTHVCMPLRCQWAAVCCSVLQCVAVCCSVLHCVPMCCSVLQRVAVYRSVHAFEMVVSRSRMPYLLLQCVAVCFCVLQYDVAGFHIVCCSVLQCIAVYRSMLQHSECYFSTWSLCHHPCHRDITLATHCNILQHTATHCNTLQHTATATQCNTLQRTPLVTETTRQRGMSHI